MSGSSEDVFIKTLDKELRFNTKCVVTSSPSNAPKAIFRNIGMDGVVCHYQIPHESCNMHRYWVSPGRWAKSIIDDIGHENAKGCVLDQEEDTLEKSQTKFLDGTYGVVCDMRYDSFYKMMDRLYEESMPYYRMLWFCNNK